MSDNRPPLRESLPPFMLAAVALLIALTAGLDDPRPAVALCIVEALLLIGTARLG